MQLRTARDVYHKHLDELSPKEKEGLAELAALADLERAALAQF